MNKRLYLGVVVLIGSLLSACSGGGNSSMPQFSQPAQPVVSHRVTQDGRTKHIFFNRDLASKERLILGQSATNNLLYWGGPIQKAPKIYLIFWGQTGPTDTSADPDGQATYLSNYVSGIGGSPWLNIDSQYGGNGQGLITNPPGNFPARGLIHRPFRTHRSTTISSMKRSKARRTSAIAPTQTTSLSRRPIITKTALAPSGARGIATRTRSPGRSLLRSCRTCRMPATRAENTR